MSRNAPSWSRLQDEPALMLAFGFGSGLSPKPF